MLKVKSPSFVTRCSISAMAMALAIGTAALPVLAQDSAAASAEQAVQTGIPAWGIDNVELPHEAGVVYGVLGNGMRYAIKRHDAAQGETSMRLLFDGGAGDEADDEEGAAHFLEHMAFNGSKNIPEGELVPMLERLGLAFGADTNAETSLDYTMYKLDLPKTDAATVDTTLKILREIASELTIDPAAVERERGILVSEYQVRNSPIRRRVEQFLKNGLSEPRLGERLTAEPAAQQNLTAEKLRNFYHGYYRPDRTTLAIVGDFDVAEMEAKIKATFASWQPVGEARTRYSIDAPVPEGKIFDSFTDPSTPELVDLQRIVPLAPSANSVAEVRMGLMENVAAVALSNRINAIARKDPTKTLGGQALVQELYGYAKAYGLILVATDGQWANALATGEQEWRRLRQFGFTESEIAEAKANIASNLATAAAQAASRRNAQIAEEIAKNSMMDRVSISPETALSIYQAVADSITAETVSDAFRAGWGDAPGYVMLAAKTGTDDAPKAMQAVLAQSAQTEVSAPVEEATAAFAYTDFGPAGQVASDARIDDLGIRTVKFANGVQLNLKKTDFEPGKIAFRMDVGQGSSAFPAGHPGLGFVASQLAAIDGIAKHDPEELRRILAGRQVGMGYGVSDSALVLSGSTTPSDAELQFQLLAAQVTDTAFRAETEQQWQAAVPILLTSIPNSPDQLWIQTFQAVLSDGDSRLGVSDPAVLAQRSVDEMRTIIGGQLANGAIRLAVVGDFDEDAVIADVAKTLGALQRADASAQPIAPVRFAAKRGVTELYHTGEADQGRISLSWPTDDDADFDDVLARELLGELLEIRLRDVLREELGATYTPEAVSIASPVLDGWGSLTMTAPATPGSMDQVSTAIRGIVEDMKTKPIDADALERARLPILESYERQSKVNAGWTGIVVDAQADPQRLDRRRQRAAILKAITADKVQATARQYLQGEPLELRIIPKAMTAPSAGS